MHSKLRWGDFVIGAVVLMLAVLAALPFVLQPSDRLTCEIKQGDTVVKTVLLADGYHDTITLTDGDITNVIEIDGRSVRFASSDCPDQVCVHTGTLTRAGQMAVCLPSRVVVRLIGADSDVDAVAR